MTYNRQIEIVNNFTDELMDRLTDRRKNIAMCRVAFPRLTRTFVTDRWTDVLTEGRTRDQQTEKWSNVARDQKITVIYHLKVLRSLSRALPRSLLDWLILATELSRIYWVKKSYINITKNTQLNKEGNEWLVFEYIYASFMIVWLWRRIGPRDR